MKNTPKDIIILQLCTINDSHMMYGSWDMECNGQFFVIFCTFIPQQPEKLKFWKNEKNTWRCYHFTHVYHKWQSYDKWFLRYGAWQTELFVILDNFLQLKNQNFEKMKKSPGDIILQKCIKNHDNMLSAPEIWHVIVEIVFFHFGQFLALLLAVRG